MPQIGKIGEAKVYIYFEDHNPPHVHVRLGENDAEVGIESPVILAGRLPPGALRGIANWLNHNKQEIIDRWRAARAGVPFNPLEGDWK